MSHKEIRAKTGEDKDGKPFYKTIGRYMETKKGPMIKLDVAPLGWDGWAYVSDPLPKDGQRPAKNLGEMDNDIPF
jgi:hypothetical protein